MAYTSTTSAIRGAEQFADGGTYMRYGSEYESKSAWRRNNLTLQLREVRDSLQSIGSHALVSVAPLGKLRKIADLGRSHGWTAYESVHQDPETWGREGARRLHRPDDVLPR